MRTILFLLILSAYSATASAVQPRAVAADDFVEVVGLPAISDDGSVVAFEEYFEASSDAALVAIEFRRVSDGARTDRWVVLSRNDNGVLDTDVTDGRGRTTWRRAKNLSVLLRDKGFRAMSSIGEAENGEEPTPPLVGSGLRVEQRRAEVTIRAARGGRERYRGRLAPMRAFCGMSDERPRNVPPRVLSAWIDRRTDIVLLEVGHVYASCMCPSDIAHQAVTLRP